MTETYPTPAQVERGLTDPHPSVRRAWALRTDYVVTPGQFERGLKDVDPAVREAWANRGPTQTDANRRAAEASPGPDAHHSSQAITKDRRIIVTAVASRIMEWEPRPEYGVTYAHYYLKIDIDRDDIDRDQRHCLDITLRCWRVVGWLKAYTTRDHAGNLRVGQRGEWLVGDTRGGVAYRGCAEVIIPGDPDMPIRVIGGYRHKAGTGETTPRVDIYPGDLRIYDDEEWAASRRDIGETILEAVSSVELPDIPEPDAPSTRFPPPRSASCNR